MSNTQHSITWTSQSETETQALGALLASHLSAGDVILLKGDLGMGKTVFARGLIKALAGENEDVPSPTFTLVQTYRIADGKNEAATETILHHFDLYRLEDPEEIWELGWEDAIANDSLALVEWPERLGPYTPLTALVVSLASGAENETHRRICLTGDTGWAERLERLKSERKS